MEKEKSPIKLGQAIPTQVIHNILFIANNSTNTIVQRMANVIILEFFFLLCPGEHTDSRSDTAPFDFQSVQLFFGSRRLDVTTNTNE